MFLARFDWMKKNELPLFFLLHHGVDVVPVCSAIFLLGPCLKTASDKMGGHHFVNQHIQEFHEWTQLMLCSKYSKYKMMIFRIVCWRKGKGLYPRGRWDLHTKSIWKGGLKKWPLNGNQITQGYTQLDIFKYMSLWTIERRVVENGHWKENRLQVGEFSLLYSQDEDTQDTGHSSEHLNIFNSLQIQPNWLELEFSESE